MSYVLVIKKRKKTTHTPLGNSAWPLPGHPTAPLLALAYTKAPSASPRGLRAALLWEAGLVLWWWAHGETLILIL